MARKAIIIASVTAAICLTVTVVTVSVLMSLDDELTTQPSSPSVCPVAEQRVTEEDCKKVEGCVWTSESCLIKENILRTYKVHGPVVQTVLGFKLFITRTEGATSLFGERSPDIKNLVLEVFEYSNDHLRFKIYDADASRYEVPVHFNIPTVSKKSKETKYRVETSSDQEDFYIRIIRQDTGTVIWDTSIGAFIFSDQYLEVNTLLPSTYIYGFGENVHDSFRHTFGKTYPIFARDEFPNEGDKDLYGVHPVYWCVEDDLGNTHGIFLVNSNAMEYTLQDTGKTTLTLRAIGGILDFHVFMGPQPAEVAQQYAKFVGYPVMPPYWALGFQLSRWGYKNLDEIRDVVTRTKEAGIPQDIQYADIDYMDEMKDFTWDKQAFSGFPEYIKEVKTHGLRFILILDPAIPIDFSDSYPPGKHGKEADIFIKWYNSSLIPDDQEKDTNDYMVGYVWPHIKTVYPDFMMKKTHEWWIEECGTLYKDLEFSGIWIDMNEPSCFGTNLEKPFNWPEGKKPWSLKCPENKWDSPPFPTKHVWVGDNKSNRLSDHTICMSGKQLYDLDGKAKKQYMHYDVHSLYGWSQAKPTLEAARKYTKTRSIVITRSSYPSSGRWAGHWLGDNFARWKDLHRSLIGMFEFNMFMIPYNGADICGFFGNATEELCLRWMQLGSFYPFSRNHNDKSSYEQDPAQWKSVSTASKIALNIRYKLLPYLYTLFHKAHTNGNTVIRPLMLEFPTDLKARDVDTQFLWGQAFLISPILTLESYNQREVYLPSGIWYDYHTGDIHMGPKTFNLRVDNTTIPLHLRGGYILPTQKPELNTAESRKNGFGLIVAPDDTASTGKAEGQLFWDDGESVDTYQNKKYSLVAYKYEKGVLSSSFDHQQFDMEKLDEIIIYSVNTNITKIQQTSPTPVRDLTSKFTWDENSKVLKSTEKLQIMMKESFTITFTIST